MAKLYRFTFVLTSEEKELIFGLGKALNRPASDVVREAVIEKAEIVSGIKIIDRVENKEGMNDKSAKNEE